ncbi:Krr1-domain-containing protein, partial [Rhizodiscina lignyota]
AHSPKRAKLIDDFEDDSDGGVALENGDGFKVNEEYAKRFEHNAKRAELHRLEEKYGKSKPKTSRKEDNGDDDSDESTSESEDDEGELATERLDAEISATLNAIRSKDPRVYDKSSKFYSAIDEENDAKTGAKKEKPMHLRDYHRKNILEGNVGSEDEDEPANPFKSYAQEEQEMEDALVKEMHAAAEDDADDDNEDAFLVRKEKPVKDSDAPTTKPSVPDVESADKDPETFLSNFFASRAWVPAERGALHPFESDDESEDARAEEFEQAYNMRFEDPSAANEKLMTYSRDTVAKKSVRREELSGRKKTRENERMKKEEAKREVEEEKARLRKLKIEEMEQRVEKIRQSAGLRGQDVDLQEWAGMLEEDWDDEKWEDVMKKRFGEGYYAAADKGRALEDDDDDDEEGEAEETKHSKTKKPKWDDDIDINDIVPDFKEDDDKPAFTLSDDEAPATNGAEDIDSDDEDQTNTKKSSSKSAKKARLRAQQDAKKTAKRDRRIIETLVEQSLDVDMATSSTTKSGKKENTLFHYRETSPIAFGLTPLDILTASDAQLNNFVGLKKLASFRDPERKRKDKKRLSKKARLREWRKETFGNEEG